MSEDKNIQRDLYESIADMIEQLIAYRRNTWSWGEAPHTLKDIITRQKELQIIGDDLSELSVKLLKQKREKGIDDTNIDAELRMIEIARGYEKEIREYLDADYKAKQAENGGAVDVVKNVTFIFGLPAAFITGVKNGIGNDQIDIHQALILGFAVSIPTVFHKKVGSLFSQTAKAVCSVPEGIRAIPASIRDDMRFVYVRTVALKKGNEAKGCFSKAAKAINGNIILKKLKRTSVVKRISGDHAPKP